MAAESMNSINLQKYGYAPNERLREIYDFYRLVRVKQHAERYEGADIEKDKKLRRKLREPLKIREKVLALAERLKKKNAPGNLYKSTTEKISFFNRDKLFVIRKIIKIPNTYHYWISKEGEDKEIDTRFLRVECYALSDPFD